MRSLGNLSKTLKVVASVAAVTFVGVAVASGDPTTLGTLAQNVTGSFSQFGSLIVSLSYVAGIGFGVAAVFKFKQHKDNPTQVPIGQPFTMLAISAGLVFMPGFFLPSGSTIFGSNASQVAGGFEGAAVTSQLPGN